MRNRSDPLLAPGASKETAIKLIRSGIEMKGGIPSAARIAKECLVRGYLLSHEERLLISFAMLSGLTRPHDVDTGETTWRLAAPQLLKRNKAEMVLHYALRLFAIEVARKKYRKAHAALEKAKVAVERLRPPHAGILHYNQCVDEYVRLSGDMEGGEGLLLK